MAVAHVRIQSASWCIILSRLPAHLLLGSAIYTCLLSRLMTCTACPLPMFGLAQGGLLPKHDWDSIDRHWLAPVTQGSQLADFALEGPLDVFLSQPTALQVDTCGAHPAV